MIHGDDLFDPVIDHGGGVDRIAGGNSLAAFQQFEGLVHILQCYRKDCSAELNYRGVCDFSESWSTDGEKPIEDFLENLRVRDRENFPSFDLVQDSFAGITKGV